jgi:hypothetical protein
MKNIYLPLIMATYFSACHFTQKTIHNNGATNEKLSKQSRPANGIYEPDSTVLKAIQKQYQETMLTSLKKGYFIYAYGVCTNCHNAKNIYQIDAKNWKNIMDAMAIEAKIDDSQKDAVYKYVLAIKAAQ